MRLALRPALLLPLLAAVASPAAAGWQEAFAEGIKARDLKQWPAAVRHMRQALAGNPDETGEKVRVYGMKWERYLPSYYLGIALYETGDCAAALEAFERTRNQGAVRLAGKIQMKSREETCRERLGLSARATAPAPPAPSPSPAPRSASGSAGGPRPTDPGGRPASPPRPAPSPPAPASPPQTTAEARRQALEEKTTEAETALRRAGEVARALDAHLERTRRAAFRGDPALEERYQAAYRRLNNARFALQGGRRENDLQAVIRAGAEAEGALTELEAVAKAVGAAAR